MLIKNINEAIKLLKDNCKNPYAQGYLSKIPEAIDDGGTDGLCLQLLYVLENCKDWKGDLAKETKAYVRTWIKEKEAINSNHERKRKQRR